MYAQHHPQHPQSFHHHHHHEYQLPHTELPPHLPQNMTAQLVDHHQIRGTELIGRPILFASGQFAGQTIRAELHEVQKANLGRKYARVDRRPLDPPPVVHLRLFYVYNLGTDRESEKEVRNYDEIQVLGLVCTVDLFPVPSPNSNRKDPPRNVHKPHPAPPIQTTFTLPSQFSSDSSSSKPQPPTAFTFVPSHVYPAPRSIQYHQQSPTHSGMPTPVPPPPLHIPLSSPSTSNTVHHVEDHPIIESSKVTHALVGATFVQPASVDYQGRKSLMFVFADLAVKIEGTFILRYRIFDIFSRPHESMDLAIQAECYGGIFRVYSTKEFPGLQASTDLTKQLARWGVRLNIRETERKRRKKGEPGSVSPSYSSTGKRKHMSPDNHGDPGDASDDDD